MSLHDPRLWAAPTAAAQVFHSPEVEIQVIGTPGTPYTPQRSLDGTNFISCSARTRDGRAVTSITAAGIYTVEGGGYIRMGAGSGSALWIRPARNTGAFTGPQSVRIGSGQGAGAPTYSYFGFIAPYATPTELFRLSGSASKVIAVTHASVSMRATAAANWPATTDLFKRTAANTGGTPTNLSADIVQHDSADAAPTATLEVYTAAPGALGAGKLFRSIYNQAIQASSVPITPYGLQGWGQSGVLQPTPMAVSLTKPLILRGAAEGLCVNLAAGALPAGFFAFLGLEWTEYDQLS